MNLRLDLKIYNIHMINTNIFTYGLLQYVAPKNILTKQTNGLDGQVWGPGAWWPVCVVTRAGGGWGEGACCEAEKVIHLSEIPIQMSRNLGWKITPVHFSNLTKFDSDYLSERRMDVSLRVNSSEIKIWQQKCLREWRICALCWIFSWEWEMKPLRSCSVMTETSWCPVTAATLTQNTEDPHVTCHHHGAIFPSK